MSRYLIVGGGIAGVSAAETIRSLDPEGALTIVSAEKLPPYSRPMIAMVLEGSASPDRLPIRDDDWADRLGIQARSGRRVVDLDLDARRARLDDGAEIQYEKLLLAVGADPRRARAENSDLDGVFYMRTREDVAGMVDALPDVDQALVLGGGLVGFKAAYGLLRRGKKATMLIRSGHPLSMQVDEEAGRIIREELEANGLTVKVQVEVEAFEGNGRLRQAHLSDGSRVDCRMAVVGKGVAPSLGFLRPGSLSTGYGLLVDQHMQTSVPDVYGAGDAAEPVDRLRQAPFVNAIWPEAVAQGRAAGANMAGRTVVYPGSMGRNVMRIFGLDVLTGGLVTPPEGRECSVLTRSDPRRRTYRKLVFEDRKLIGAVLVNGVEQGGVLLSLIQRGEPLTVDPERLLEPSFNFAALLP